jgi:hypothetical protein
MRASAIRARSRLVARLQLIIPLTQYILTANILLVVFQILVGSEYSVMSLVLVTLASNCISAILFLVFAIKFLSWYRNPDHNVGILLFTSTFVILGFLNFMAGVGYSYLLLQKDQILNASSIVEFRDFAEGTFFNRFYNYYDYLDYISFLLLLV